MTSVNNQAEGKMVKHTQGNLCVCCTAYDVRGVASCTVSDICRLFSIRGGGGGESAARLADRGNGTGPWGLTPHPSECVCVCVCVCVRVVQHMLPLHLVVLLGEWGAACRFSEVVSSLFFFFTYYTDKSFIVVFCDIWLLQKQLSSTWTASYSCCIFVSTLVKWSNESVKSCFPVET